MDERQNRRQGNGRRTPGEYYGENPGNEYYGNGSGGREGDGSYRTGEGQNGYYGNDRNYYGNGAGGRQSGYYEEDYNTVNGAYRGGAGNMKEDYYENGPANGPAYYGPQDFEDDGSRKRRARKQKKKKRRKLIFALEVLVLLIIAGGLFAAVQLNRMDHVNLNDILVNTGISKSGYRNIALFGVDSREGDLESGTNSDTIIVCSINNKTGNIKLASVYRDTYLDNTNGQYRKATECYAGGGAERAINMLNKNLDLDITDFVTVDFNAIVKMVDLIGGIELDVTEEELQWLNGYCVENQQVTGVDYEPLTSAGYQHLTGIQALAYCRIRYTEGWDYKRTERQREVLGKIFAKAQSQGVASLISIATSMMDNIATSLNTAEMISLVSGISKYTIEATYGFPYEKSTTVISAGDVVVPVNLAANVKQLHLDLFGDADYTPSATVQEISNKIVSDTGIG